MWHYNNHLQGQIMKKILLIFTIICVTAFSGCTSEQDVLISESTGTEDSVSVSEKEFDESVIEEVKPIEIFLPKAYYTECDLPVGDFQKSLSFPDRLGFHNNALFVNSISGFAGT